jgi:uncharacterized protein (TIGR02246 family)
MRSKLFAIALILAGIVLVAATAGQKAGQKSEPTEAARQPQTPAPDHSQDEKAIRQTAEEVVRAYNTADAKTLAALFSSDAEIVDHHGNASQGRQAIEQEFAEVFADNPGGKIEIDVDSIRFVCPNVAIEDGTSTVQHAASEPAVHCRYTVIHVKEGGKWLMTSARDLPDEEPAAKEQLKQFEWLIGEWVDESEVALVQTNYRWADNNKFIVNEFTVQIEGRPALTGTMRIGWDPLRKHVRSWIFDSEGGFGDGLWARQGDEWVLTLSGVTRDGKVGSRTMVMTRLGKDRYSWEAHDCMVNGELLSDLDPVTVVRTPPKPLESN